MKKDKEEHEKVSLLDVRTLYATYSLSEDIPRSLSHICTKMRGRKGVFVVSPHTIKNFKKIIAHGHGPLRR